MPLPDYTPPKWDFVRDTGEALYTRYRNGAIVHHLPVIRANGGDAGERDVILDQSPKSRRNAAFKFGNASCTWSAMILFTWHSAPEAEAVKTVWKKFVRAWRERFQEPPCGWLMEMQERGVPHFHVFVAKESACGQQIEALKEDGRIEAVSRNGKDREVVRGNLDKWMQRTWLECSEQTDDADARYVHSLGICELMLSPDAAGRYVAKECSKRNQKVLPEKYAEGLGRWWYLNPRWKPQPVARGFVSLDDWPFVKPFAHVWQSDDIQAAGRGEWAIGDDKKAAPFISAWLKGNPGYIGPDLLDANMVKAIRERNRRESLCEEPKDLRSEDDIAEEYAEACESMRKYRLDLEVKFDFQKRAGSGTVAT